MLWCPFLKHWSHTFDALNSGTHNLGPTPGSLVPWLTTAWILFLSNHPHVTLSTSSKEQLTPQHFLLTGSLFQKSFNEFMGVQRAASPWRTLGIRSCRTFCSDLAWWANALTQCSSQTVQFSDCRIITIFFLVDSVISSSSSSSSGLTCFGTVWPFWCWCAVKLWYNQLINEFMPVLQNISNLSSTYLVNLC